MGRSDLSKQRRSAEKRAEEKEAYVGVYSVKSVARGNPTSIWLGVDGAEHEVIAVYKTESQARSQEPWDDLRVVGRVLRYVRPGRPALNPDGQPPPRAR